MKSQNNDDPLKTYFLGVYQTVKGMTIKKTEPNHWRNKRNKMAFQQWCSINNKFLLCKILNIIMYNGFISPMCFD